MSWIRRLLASRSWVLVLGSALASGLNFYSFLILPALTGVSGLEQFVRDNYLGGLYLFGIGSSIAPFSVFVFAGGRRHALARYGLLAALAFGVIGLGGHRLARWPWSYLCMLGAACMHAAGFFLAALMRQGHIRTAALLQTAQPAGFAALVSIERFGSSGGRSWAVLYVLSCVAGLAAFIATSDRRAIADALRGAPSERVDWYGIVTRVALSVSFPLFFQLELILGGNLSGVNVGVYSMLQKLYSSIATSLFGSLGVLMLMRGGGQRSGRDGLIDARLALMSLASAGAVLGVGTVMALIGKAATLSPALIAGCAAVAFMFTLGSFISLKLNAFRPFVGLGAFAGSLAVYLALFFSWRPASAGGLLAAAGVFFVVFIGLGSWTIAPLFARVGATAAPEPPETAT